jgi:hypothetical protein
VLVLPLAVSAVPVELSAELSVEFWVSLLED